VSESGEHTFQRVFFCIFCCVTVVDGSPYALEPSFVEALLLG
jgi:hypothetical protein